jgi:hypothetical protein
MVGFEMVTETLSTVVPVKNRVKVGWETKKKRRNLFFFHIAMPSLHLPSRAFQSYNIFAANTNVGKTVFATGLCRAAALQAQQNNKRVFYLKPVQTGYPVDSDARHVDTFTKKGTVSTSTLYAYKDPVSPHVATLEVKKKENKRALDGRVAPV